MDNFNLREYLAEGKLKETQLNMFREMSPELRKKLDDEYDTDWFLKDHPDKKEDFYNLLMTYSPDGKYGSLKKAMVELFGFDNMGPGSDSGELIEWFYNLVRSETLEEGEINIKPQLDIDHHIVFKNPDAASRKLYNAGVDFENVGFLFPKMSYETWETIKELFSNDEIGDMGQS